MIKNYFKIALRNLKQQKALSFINIAGLSIGLACFSLFLLFAVNEFSFDRFHKNTPNIYRVVEWVQGFPGRAPGGEAFGGVPLGPAMKKDFPDVENYVRVQTGFEEKLVQVNNQTSRSRITYADPGIFNVFSFKLILGKKDALNNPRNIVLTNEKALQLFGNIHVLGRRVDIKVGDEFEPFIVGAVAENVPVNSSIQFSILGSYDYLMNSDMAKESMNDWHIQIGSETYIQLRRGSELMNDAKRLAEFRTTHLPEENEELKKAGFWDGKGPLPVSFRLQPLRDVHTNARIGGIASNIDPKYIWILISIAAGILLIACINFTTLAIGRSAGRAKEIGVRKVMGGQRKQLILQFLTESFILSILSGILALVLAKWLLPVFNQLSGVKISFSFSQFPELLWLLASLIILTAILAGIYPALVLSGFKPVDVLKSKIRLKGSNLFTKSLVTFQFVLSISLIISTIIILQQTTYMRTKDLGFKKENVVVVNAEGSDAKKIYRLFKQSLEKGTDVINVAASEIGLGEGTGLMGAPFQYKGETKGMIQYPVDAGFLKMMGMKLIAGRDFDPKLSIDTVSSIIVNEAMLSETGLTVNNVIGQQIGLMVHQNNQADQFVPKIIIGVIKNFNFSRLNQKVRPQMFFIRSSLEARNFFVRIKQGYPSGSLATIKKTWETVAPGLPFQYSFLDENFARFYKNETRWSNIVGCAGTICIFLACLGLFGLAALAAVNRTKEIGIRKVLGASVSAIVRLLSKDFLKLVIISIILAVPLSWFFMSKWLMDYAYRINISWWVFGITSLIALGIAFLTISIQSVKTAMENPVNSLRTE